MPPIKVALIGNMNNNFFSLMRYLRDLGIEADLFLFENEMSHFLPDNDTWNLEAHTKSIKRLNYGNPIVDLFKFRKDIVQDFREYDFLVGCDYSPYYLMKINRPLDLFIPYGSDLYEFPLKKPLSSANTFKSIIIQGIKNFLISSKQRRGVLAAKKIVCIDIIETYKVALQKLGCVSLKWPVPIVYNEVKPQNIVAPSELSSLILKIESFDFRVISQSRQYWTTSMDSATQDDIKNNDLLIKGFAKFLFENKCNACLILFSYGPDVEKSKQLIKELDIENNVIWMPKMSRKWILHLITNYAHIGADQFKGGYFGGTGYEILACGKPLMNTVSILPSEFENFTEMQFPPIINVRTADEICSALSHYFLKVDELKQLSFKSYEWFNQNLGIGCAEKYVTYFKEQMLKKQKIA